MEKAKERFWYIDNLRLLLIVFVVMHHLAVTYSGFGMFYYIEGRHLDFLSTVWFSFYLSLQQGYFMGLLFLIAGYFAAGSYDRKGFGPFVKERFRRLVIPSLIYMAVITPFIIYVELGPRNVLQPKPGFHPAFLGFLSGTGVMWFAVALFFFSFVYGLVRLIARQTAPVSNNERIRPSFSNAVILILIIAVCAFLIRIVQPIGTNILNMQLCFFASYIVLFIVGIVAYRNSLFARIGYQTGKRWLIGGLVLGLLFWLELEHRASLVPGGTVALSGGMNWESAGYALWESFVAVAMSIGLIGVFREKCNHQSRLIRAMSDSSFAVYIWHPPILTAVTLLFKPVALYPVVKWAVLCIICVPLCFAAAYFVFRRIPLLNKVL